MIAIKTTKTKLNENNIQFSSSNVHAVKLALLGEGAVGKTSLRRKYLGIKFTSEYLLTIGADFATNIIPVTENITFKAQIWDLAGQPRFSGVRKAYYLGCLGGLLIFDRTRPETLENTMNWLNELWNGSGRGPIPFIILGNKSDLLHEDHLKLEKKAKLWTKVFTDETVPKKGFKVHYLKTSAKTGLNVDKAFGLLAKEILNYINWNYTDKKTS
ncbi:MAG: GTP-binding protein [Candidatus Hodarchaeales archaeon]